jgi:hypothetical protein
MGRGLWHSAGFDAEAVRSDLRHRLGTLERFETSLNLTSAKHRLPVRVRQRMAAPSSLRMVAFAAAKTRRFHSTTVSDEPFYAITELKIRDRLH